MPEHLLIVRLRSASGFNVSRESLRETIEGGLTAWPVVGMRLVSISPLPADRYIKPRKSPTTRSFPLLDFINKGN
jgi:hypothetical protein